MKAELINTGTELLLGQILNTNAQYLSQQLALLGIDVYFHTTVGDNEFKIAMAVRQALEHADLVITTGGLGPTQDDITKETVATVLGLDMQPDNSSMKSIQAFFDKINKPMSLINQKQGYFPKEAKILPNDMGTAPGAIIEQDNKIIIILPGPPVELQPMFENYVIPYLKLKTSLNALIKSRTLRIFGIGESSAQEVLADIFANQSNPSIAFNAKSAEIHIRLTVKASSLDEANEMMDNTERLIRERIGQHIFGVDDETMEVSVGKLLREKGITLSLAESCTGGMVASRLTEVSGSSEYIMYGIVSYSNQAKEKILGVRKETINKYGAVSKETAEEMARGVRQINDSDIGLSVTGIAGPGGGTDEKPVGLVYIGLSTPEITFVKKFNFAGNRQLIRLLSSTAALNMIRRYIKEKKID